MPRLKIISSSLIDIYKEQQLITLQKRLNNLTNKVCTPTNFHFYLVNSSCNSSMIEGSTLDSDTYYKLKEAGYISKDVCEIDCMLEAYNFAITHEISYKNILKTHKFISKLLPIPESYKGTLRDKGVCVKKNGETIYCGAPVEIVESELKKLFDDIKILIERKLTLNEVFYYASMIHIIFVHIHPFADGNGRIARLLEKWFLAQKLGKTAWQIQSEKLYFKRSASYYKRLNIGKNYEQTRYDLSLPFLLMLPMALNIK